MKPRWIFRLHPGAYRSSELPWRLAKKEDGLYTSMLAWGYLVLKMKCITRWWHQNLHTTLPPLSTAVSSPYFPYFLDLPLSASRPPIWGNRRGSACVGKSHCPQRQARALCKGARQEGTSPLPTSWPGHRGCVSSERHRCLCLSRPLEKTSIFS